MQPYILLKLFLNNSFPEEVPTGRFILENKMILVDALFRKFPWLEIAEYNKLGQVIKPAPLEFSYLTVEVSAYNKQCCYVFRASQSQDER
jgi:hypothetical protein